jgi:hypothetical protein
MVTPHGTIPNGNISNNSTRVIGKIALSAPLLPETGGANARGHRDDFGVTKRRSRPFLQ